MEFENLKKPVQIEIIHGTRGRSIFRRDRKEDKSFAELLGQEKIAGVFSSPPYVGHIDYHEQHAYAYELFGISRRDDDEIGTLANGAGKRAREDYVRGISEVRANAAKYVRDDGQFFIVANDKHNLYPVIAERSGLRIAEEYKRPVLNRTERDGSVRRDDLPDGEGVTFLPRNPF
jgi:hypothetical protein